jgi:hypothetical protein
MPAVDLADGIELTGMARAPKRDRRALVENPANRERQYRLAEAVVRQCLELADGGEIALKPRR